MASRLASEGERDLEKDASVAEREGKKTRDTGMQEIREAVNAYYKAATHKQLQLARYFFNSLDADGDGKISLHEYLQFFRKQGITLINNRSFFQDLDEDGDGNLDFKEVLAFYYIIKTRRPFCDGCSDFLKGLFFTCVECHNRGNPSFDLCCECYGNGSFTHEHTTIIDNYVVLAQLRDQRTVAQSTTSQLTRAQSTSSTSTQLVPVRQATSKTEIAFQLLNAGIAVGNWATSFCGIM